MTRNEIIWSVLLLLAALLFGFKLVAGILLVVAVIAFAYVRLVKA